MIGDALGNAMNMGVTLAVYGSICRETGQPFVFPGSPQQWAGVTDITDARLLGRHVAWSATDPAGRNQAFNTVNGEVFRWRQMWGRVAEGLGVEAADYPGEPQPLEGRMSHADRVWSDIVARHDLAPHAVTELASWSTGRHVSSALDATTEIELWAALRSGGATVAARRARRPRGPRPTGSSSSNGAGSWRRITGASSPRDGPASPTDHPT